MMLPEHKAQLLAERKKKEKRSLPILDEDERERIDRTIHEALERDCPIVVTYVRTYDVQQFSGRIKKIDRLERSLTLTNEREDVTIPFRHLLRVEIK